MDREVVINIPQARLFVSLKNAKESEVFQWISLIYHLVLRNECLNLTIHNKAQKRRS